MSSALAPATHITQCQHAHVPDIKPPLDDRLSSNATGSGTTVSESGIGRGGLKALAQQLLVIVPGAVALMALDHSDGEVAVGLTLWQPEVNHIHSITPVPWTSWHTTMVPQRDINTHYNEDNLEGV